MGLAPGTIAMDAYGKIVGARNADIESLAHVFSINPHLNRPPDYWLNVFNISPRQFERRRPPDNPYILIKPCPAGEPYVLACRVPNVISYHGVSPETGQLVYGADVGERFATDLLNPANLTNDCWFVVQSPDPEAWMDDLTIRGVFWTRNDVPTKEELTKARARMEATYRRQIDRAEEMARTGEGKYIGAEAHMGCDYFHEEHSWHRISIPPEQCPNCGDMIKPGIALHMSSVGVRCVIDWRRAVAAGAIKRDEVPDDMRWWTEEKEEKRNGKKRQTAEGEEYQG